MQKQEILNRIQQVGVLPVLRANSASEALAIAAAIEAGGISAVEVTMTVPGAVSVIEKMVQDAGDRILIGAGTVLDPETARACILAGAKFVVSPALNVKTIEMCRRYSIPVMSGALSPTEVVTAWEAGADIVKVFPCSAVGGASYLKALKAPFPHIELVPTGGVTVQTAADFLKAGAFALGVGGDLVDRSAIVAGTPGLLTEKARAYCGVIANCRREALIPA